MGALPAARQRFALEWARSAALARAGQAGPAAVLRVQPLQPAPIVALVMVMALALALALALLRVLVQLHLVEALDWPPVLPSGY